MTRCRHSERKTQTSERAAEQPIGHDLLQPLAVKYIQFTPRDVLGVARINQQNGKATRLKQFEQRNPVPPGRFHRHRVHAAGRQPVGQFVESIGEASKLAYWFFVTIRRHGDIVGCAAISMPVALGWVIVIPFLNHP